MKSNKKAHRSGGRGDGFLKYGFGSRNMDRVRSPTALYALHLARFALIG